MFFLRYVYGNVNFFSTKETIWIGHKSNPGLPTTLVPIICNNKWFSIIHGPGKEREREREKEKERKKMKKEGENKN